MKQHNVRNLIILVLLMIALGLVYCMIRYHYQKDQEAQSADAEKKVLSLEQSDVEEIQFTLEEQQVTFVKDGTEWKLMGDDSFKVNASAVESVISAVTGMTSQRTLEDVTDLAEYGLDQPLKTVVLKSQEGVSYPVCFGNSNETTGNDYVCVGDDKTKVYTVSSDIGSSLAGTLEDFRAAREDTEDSKEGAAKAEDTEDAETEE